MQFSVSPHIIYFTYKILLFLIKLAHKRVSIEKPVSHFHIVNTHLLACFLLFSLTLCTHMVLMPFLCLCVSVCSLYFQNGEEILKGNLDRRKRVSSASYVWTVFTKNQVDLFSVLELHYFVNTMITYLEIPNISAEKLL